jgi:hypothetical protein
MSTVRSIQQILVPLALGCAALIGCTEPSSRFPRLGVGYRADGAYADPALFRAEVTQGGRRWVIEPSRLTIRARSSTHVEANAEVRRIAVGEPLTVRVALVLGPGDTAAAGSVSWTPEPDWSYSVFAVAGTDRPPRGFCVLSVTHVSQLPPRAGTEGDTLFIERSGLPEGAVC